MTDHTDMAPCFFFSCEENGPVTYINETLCRRLGYTKDELLGQRIDLFLPVASRIFQQTHLGPLLKMLGYANEIFISLKCKDNTQVPVLINAQMNTGDAVNNITYAGIEVQHRQQYEAELIAARKEAEKALADNSALNSAKKELERNLELLDKQLMLVHKYNKELLQFSKVITHDLQEPVRKMSVFSDMLGKDDSVLQQADIKVRMMAALDRIKQITAGLQQYMWLEEGRTKLSLVDIKSMMPDILGQLKREYPAVQLNLSMDEVPQIIADEAQMRILLYQLLSNAIQFRKEDDRAVAHLRADSQQLNIYRKLHGRYKYADFIRLELSDEGVGIDNAQAEKAFELFRRLHTQSGMGIGLALCRKIVECHHGEISIRSKAGGGTTVRILLPAKVAAHQSESTIVS